MKKRQTDRIEKMYVRTGKFLKRVQRFKTESNTEVEVLRSLAAQTVTYREALKKSLNNLV